MQKTATLRALGFLKEVGIRRPGCRSQYRSQPEVGGEGETYEYTQMYPGMAKRPDEGFADWRMVRDARQGERSHANRFTKGLDSLKQL